MENNLLPIQSSSLTKWKTIVNDLISKSESNLKNVLNIPYIKISLYVFLALYSAYAAPKLPKNVALLMDSTIVRILFTSLIIYAAFKNEPLTALMIAIAFIITLQTADKYKIYDSSLSITDGNSYSWLPSAKNGAVMGKELYDNPVDLLKKRMLQSEKAKDKYLEKDFNKTHNVIDAELVRQNSHNILNNGFSKIKTHQSPRLIQLTADLASGVVDTVGHVGQGTYDLSKDVVNGTVRGVSKIGKGTLNATSSVGAGVLSGTYRIGSGVRRTTNELSDGVITGVHAVGKGVLGGIRDIKSGLVGGVSRLGDCVIDSASEIGTGLLSGVKNISDGVVEGAARLGTSTIDGISYTGEGVLDGVYMAGTGLTRGTHQLSNSVLDGVHQTSSQMMNGVRTGGSHLKLGSESLLKPLYLAEHLVNVPEPGTNCPYSSFTSELQLASAGDNNVKVVPSTFINNNATKKSILEAEHMTDKVGSCEDNTYTSQGQLDSARNNSLEDSTEDNNISSFCNQYNAQGTYSNFVNGYGGKDYSTY